MYSPPLRRAPRHRVPVRAPLFQLFVSGSVASFDGLVALIRRIHVSESEPVVVSQPVSSSDVSGTRSDILVTSLLAAPLCFDAQCNPGDSCDRHGGGCRGHFGSCFRGSTCSGKEFRDCRWWIRVGPFEDPRIYRPCVGVGMRGAWTGVPSNGWAGRSWDGSIERTGGLDGEADPSDGSIPFVIDPSACASFHGSFLDIPTAITWIVGLHVVLRSSWMGACEFPFLLPMHVDVLSSVWRPLCHPFPFPVSPRPSVVRPRGGRGRFHTTLGRVDGWRGRPHLARILGLERGGSHPSHVRSTIVGWAGLPVVWGRRETQPDTTRLEADPTASHCIRRQCVFVHTHILRRWPGSRPPWRWPSWPPLHTPTSTSRRPSTVRVAKGRGRSHRPPEKGQGSERDPEWNLREGRTMPKHRRKERTRKD